MKTKEEEYPHNYQEQTDSEETKNALQKPIVIFPVLFLKVTCFTMKVRVCADLDQDWHSNQGTSYEVKIGPEFDGYIISLVKDPAVNDILEYCPKCPGDVANGHD